MSFVGLSVSVRNNISVEEGQFHAAIFEGCTAVSVCVRAEDNEGPEAFLLTDNKGLMVVGEVES